MTADKELHSGFIPQDEDSSGFTGELFKEKRDTPKIYPGNLLNVLY